MPTDTIVVLIMATAFGIFAATLYYTGRTCVRAG